ncbi:MAG: hypothetical protein EXR92_05515 [Gemmatimonadetes bacterium]|nr:hypothetical protein [Gemmatimonadota bacterium]
MNHIEPIEPQVPLEELDPGRGDLGYWVRFQQRVMGAVAPELAARRRAALTLGYVLLSWGRLAVPMAVVAAAAIAGLLLLRPALDEDFGSVVGLEELLSVPRDGEEPLPAFLYSDETVDRDQVLLAVEGGGFTASP